MDQLFYPTPEQRKEIAKFQALQKSFNSFYRARKRLENLLASHYPIGTTVEYRGAHSWIAARVLGHWEVNLLIEIGELRYKVPFHMLRDYYLAFDMRDPFPSENLGSKRGIQSTKGE